MNLRPHARTAYGRIWRIARLNLGYISGSISQLIGKPLETGAKAW
jgi:hypothetical protein